MEFRQDVADEICERLARGDSLRKICGADRDDFIPGATTVFKWLDEHEAFAKQYARARELQAEFYADEIVAIADAPNATTNAAGEVEMRDPARDRLRVETRKWVASKLLPKKYGDRQVIEHEASDGLADRLAAAWRRGASGSEG